MNDLRTLDIPKVTDGNKFEYLCRDIFRNNPDLDIVELNGRSGQTQNGVDVFAREKINGEWIGIQCKCRSKGKQLSKSDINIEVDKAKKFNPKISTLYIYTTCERDVKVQEMEREINNNLSRNGEFTLKIKFWPDIEEELKKESNFNVYYRYYKNYFVDNTTLGHAVSKLFNLDLCFDGSVDTHYELMLGKIPNYKDKKPKNANYYRGTYFIVNLHENKMETFTTPCHDIDITQAFPNVIDRHRVCNWLSTLHDLEEFISSDEENCTYSLSYEKRMEFMVNFDE